MQNMVSCLQPIDSLGFIPLGKGGLTLKEFLHISDVISEDEVKQYMNIKDATKQQILQVLLNRWMLCRMGRDELYIKHVPSNRMNVLYQIVLSGQPWDGVYELALKGKKIKAKGYIIDDKNTLVLESNGNYNLAVFSQGEGKEPRSVCRMDFDSDEEFCQALLATGLVSKEDLEIYHKPDDLIRPYLNRVLPRLVLR